MKVENVDLGIERKLLTLLITSDIAAQKLLPILDKNGVRTTYSKQLLIWIREFHDQYKEAPKEAIQEIYEQKKLSIRDRETASSISVFLESLADEYDSVEKDYSNIDFHIKDCEKYIRRVNLENLREHLDAALSMGDVTKGESLIAGYTQKAIPESQGISLLHDIEPFRECFDEQHLEPLFQFGGALGKVIGPYYRGDLSACIATSKCGKSWETEGVAFCAAAAGCRVLVLNLEMRDIELRQRYWRGLVNAPIVSGPVSMPFFRPDKEDYEDLDNEDVRWRIDHKIMNMKGVSFTDTTTLMNTMHMRYKAGDIRLMSLSKKSTDWNAVESIVDNLAYYDNYIPDLIIVDYLDLFYSEEREYRHRLNQIWSEARDFGLSRNIHIHTVSQANSLANDGKEIGLDSIAEDQRKKSHVSLLYGMWATSADQEAGVIRIKQLVGRGKRETFDSAICLQSLDTGQFCIASKLASKVEGV